MNIISYNQLIQMFEDFATAHLQLNDFGVGPTSEIGTSRQMRFPYMWITHRAPSNINIQNKTQIPDMVLTFIIVDQINNQENYLDVNGIDSDNQQEILSDAFQILQDLVNYISTQMGQFGVQIVDGTLSPEAIFDETTDAVTGWVTDITLRLKHSNCVTPVGDIVFTVPGQSNISFRYLTCDTLNNCNVFTDAIDNLQDQIDIISGSTTPCDISFAISDETTQITSGSSKVILYAPYSFTLTNVKASLSISGSTQSQFDVNINDSSVLSTKISIDANENRSVDAGTQPVISSSTINENDKISVDIDVAGTGAAGAKIYLIGTR
jgi:hypothetical protein